MIISVAYGLVTCRLPRFLRSLPVILRSLPRILRRRYRILWSLPVKSQYLKLDPPTNSRMMLVGGISLSLMGRK